MKKRLFTGMQPSGTLHIGNYFGALKPFVDTYENFESHIMVADLHALTSLRDGVSLKRFTIDMVKDWIASGVDPEKVVLFKQSDIQEHTELAWILECQVTVPFLMQAHAYKDKVAKGIEATAGLFNYPMLQAADILLYDAEVVPVGEDQRQHIEYAREAAGKFNRAYNTDIFTTPEEIIFESVGVVPGIDGQKMSKSYKNTIPLFGTKEEIAKEVMSIVTDSSGDRPENVYAIHKLFRTETELDALYEKHKGKYKNLKEALIEDIEATLAPMRSKRESLTDEDVAKVLKEGGERARERAARKMAAVRKLIGTA